ncbi:MAG: peptidase S10 [Sphingopyxis sp.]|nr:peptidase S10 [Sphingopyxis sp.]
MKFVTAATLALALAGCATAQSKEPRPASEAAPADQPYFTPTEVRSSGSVTVGGTAIAYQAVAGTLIVHPKGWTDTLPAERRRDKDAGGDVAASEASMFYTAYFKDGAPAENRPITFLFNGGPGSPTLWLHMGAFGPMRVETPDLVHGSAPYRTIPNAYSLLDASDLVFVDAPGTGFSRVAGKDKEKAWFGVDQDIHAFTVFVRDFLSKYGRWKSPKYIFGESYGTMRAAGMTLALQKQDIDLNGVILLSDILNWDLLPDDPQVNPGVDLPYVVALPTYAATAWYHKRAGAGRELQPFLREVETFATTDYALALMKGNSLSDVEREAIAARLHAYTGLPVAYLLKTNLRIEYGALQKELLADKGLTTGTLDTRFTGITLDPLSKVASNDPQGAAIGAAYTAAFNDYARGTLGYGAGQHYEGALDVYESWDYRHQPPGADRAPIALPNVLPDLAVAMKQNPKMKLLVTGGYFDVSTPYYAGRFELQHLPVPKELQANIAYQYYPAGHMIYVNVPLLAEMHRDVGDFIRRTDGIGD